MAVWVQDPNTQVRERLGYVFDSFRRLGVVRAVVRDLRRQGLELPTRVTAKEANSSLIWKAPTVSAVIRILHNPGYAGAYVYGRSEYFSERRSPKTGKASAHVRNVAQWPVRITEHHPGYIGWEEFVKNQEQLRQNWGHDENRGVPREGRALLQGIVYCGVCGLKMSVQNRSMKESRWPSYVCGRGYQSGEEKSCQCMTSRPIDAAVVEAFLAAISPVNVRVATQVMDQMEQELVSQRRQRELQLEQARYEARLAQRQYDAVDPSNRLVAAELERRWNEKLERVTELERAFAQAEGEAKWKLTAEERAAITDLSRDLPAIWSAETTTNQERKQLLRMAIESVQVGRDEPSGADGSADSLAFRHDNERKRKADHARRRLTENARRSRFTDSQNGAAAHLWRNCHSAESRRPAQCLWPAFYESARRIYLSKGRVGRSESALRFESGRQSRLWWSPKKLNKRCFVFQVYSEPVPDQRCETVRRVCGEPEPAAGAVDSGGGSALQDCHAATIRLAAGEGGITMAERACQTAFGSVNANALERLR